MIGLSKYLNSKSLKNNFQSLLDLFLESNCPLCERPSPQTICDGCLKKLYKSQLSKPSRLWEEKDLPVFGWGKYDGTLKRALFAIKYENQPLIGQALGNLLGEAWLRSSLVPKRNIIVIPIPMYLEKQKQRGYNQAELIAQGFCSTTGFKLNTKILTRVKSTVPQYGLTNQERAKNLHNAFFIQGNPNKLLGSSIVLVDDIYTTGATAKSAKLALKAHKIDVVGIAAIALAVRQM